MTVLALPALHKSRRRWLPYAIAVAVLALVGVGGFAGFKKWKAGTVTSPIMAAKFYAVAPMDFDVKVLKDGELAAVNNIDILNLVEGSSTIVQIVKEGSYVHKGDKLVEIDSSEIRQKIEDGTLDVQKSETDVVTARELRAIQESENSAALEAAQIEVDLAALALKQYVEGTYVQSLADADTAVKMAETTSKTKQERLDQTRSLYAKGFVTGSEVKDDELASIQAKNTLDSAKMSLKVLKNYTYPTQLATAKNRLVQAQQALERVKKRNASQLANATNNERSAEQVLVTKKRKLEHLNEQLGYCVIKAPADGMVVYAGDRNYSQSQIIEGAQVRERQQLLRLPDTAAMKAVVRINESQVPKLRNGQKAIVKIVGVTEPVAATLTKISPLADSGSRWWNPDLKEYPVELTLDRTPKDIKPGIGVQAEIYTDRLSDVLAVPLAAIYADRSNNYVFVKDNASGDVKPVPVKIAETNETHARVASGITPGQSVLLLQAGQGRDLLERAGISTSDGDASKKGRPTNKGKNPAESTAVAGAASAAPAPAAAAAAAAAVPPKKKNHAAKPTAEAPPASAKPAVSARIEPAA
jgi:HlyD family secretion protein